MIGNATTHAIMVFGFWLGFIMHMKSDVSVSGGETHDCDGQASCKIKVHLVSLVPYL